MFSVPGSFNPLHQGHVELVLACLKATNRALLSGGKQRLVVFEIAAVNADKSPLSKEQMLSRIEQFNPHTNQILKESGLTSVAVCLTTSPLFVQKAKIFKDCIFLVGIDTYARLIDPKYYGPRTSSAGGENLTQDLPDNNVGNMIAALSEIGADGCRFFVAGRKVDEGFATLSSMMNSDLARDKVLPSKISRLFTGLSEEDFRLDLSSTEIRKLHEKAK